MRSASGALKSHRPRTPIRHAVVRGVIETMTTPPLFPRRRARSRSYYVGAAGFLALGFSLTMALYIATVQVDYVWRWNRVPQYFFYQDREEIRAEIQGEIESVSAEGEYRRILLKGAEGEKAVVVPAHDLRVAKGDLVSAGDVLAS